MYLQVLVLVAAAWAIAAPSFGRSFDRFVVVLPAEGWTAILRPRQRRVRSPPRSMLRMSSTYSAANSPPPVYPVQRGSEVDSRKIVATARGRQHLQAVRMAHILFATEELATASLQQVRSSLVTFEQLARQISACAVTRDHGGLLGWVPVTLESEDKEDPFEAMLPKEARERVTHITTKPGDIVMVQSVRGYHLVQIQDVMVDVLEFATYRKSRKTSSQHYKWHGLKAQTARKEMTYKIETMGCQMNLNDSEVGELC
jgi:hypothetical protein